VVKDKNIFIAHNWLDSTLNRQSKEMAIYFSENNTVFFLNAKSKVEAHKVNNNLSVLNWPGKRPTGIRDLLFAIKIMRRHKPNIVISSFAANNIMLFVSWFFGAEKRICYYHTLVSQYIQDKGSLNFEQRLKIFRKGFFWRKATHILASSNSAMKDILKYYNVNEENIYIFPNAIPDKQVINKGDKNKIGFIGRLHRSKGVDVLIDAFYKLSFEFPALRLCIAGGGDMKEALEKQVERLLLKDKVTFEGGIDNDKICDFLASVNFLVVPSRIDNLPTVVLESFSTATPVIASNVGGIPDMVEDNINGLLFENENVEDLYFKMKLLVTGGELWNKLSKNARIKFIDKYSLEKLPARFEQLLANN